MDKSDSIKSFEELYPEIRGMVVHIIIKMDRSKTVDPDDYGLEMYESYLKAKRSYNGGKYRFNFYLMTALKWALVKRYLDDKKLDRIKTVSYDEPILEDQTNWIMRTTPGKIHYEYTEFKFIIESIEKELNDRERIVLKMKLQGYLVKEIAPRIGKTVYMTNNHVWPRIKDKIRAKMAGESWNVC